MQSFLQGSTPFGVKCQGARAGPQALPDMIHIHSLHSLALFSSLTSFPDYLQFPLNFVCVFPPCPNPFWMSCPIHHLWPSIKAISKILYYMPLSSAFLLSPVALWGRSPVLTCRNTYVSITTPINLYSVCILERQGSAFRFVMFAYYSV